MKNISIHFIIFSTENKLRGHRLGQDQKASPPDKVNGIIIQQMRLKTRQEDVSNKLSLA